MINKNFKIILFNGGFAGDLITALYNPETFKSFNKNSVVLADSVTILKDYEFMTNNSINQKISYLKSIEQIGVCSSHDLELSLRLKNYTYLVHCSDHSMAKNLYNRIPRKKQDLNVFQDAIMTFNEYLAWQDSSKKIFKKQIDIAKIKESDFLENLDIANDKSKEVLEKWIVLNKDLIVND
jgi:hypothetical protein